MFLRIIFFKIYKYEIVVVSLSRTLAYILNPAMHKSSCFKILNTTKFKNCDDLTVKGNIIVFTTTVVPNTLVCAFGEQNVC